MLSTDIMLTSQLFIFDMKVAKNLRCQIFVQHCILLATILVCILVYIQVYTMQLVVKSKVYSKYQEVCSKISILVTAYYLHITYYCYTYTVIVLLIKRHQSVNTKYHMLIDCLIILTIVVLCSMYYCAGSTLFTEYYLMVY